MSAVARIAVISGGSSGIGKALVGQLHADGWRVHTCARDPDKLAALEHQFPGVQTTVCDLRDRATVRAWAASVLSIAGAVDLLVSNAGGLHEVDFCDADLANVDLTADLRGNFESAVNLIAEFMPGLRLSAGGALLIVGSGYGLAPATRAPLYSAAKAALHSLSKSLRRQLAPHGIRVTELLPPVVDTPAVAHRKVPKLSVEVVAAAAIAGALRGDSEVRPGAVRFLPLLLRLAPGFAERLVAGT